MRSRASVEKRTSLYPEYLDSITIDPHVGGVRNYQNLRCRFVMDYAYGTDDQVGDTYDDGIPTTVERIATASYTNPPVVAPFVWSHTISPYIDTYVDDNDRIPGNYQPKYGTRQFAHEKSALNPNSDKEYPPFHLHPSFGFPFFVLLCAL